MFAVFKKLRHPWLWYAAAGEAFVITVVVLLIAHSAPVPQEETHQHAAEPAPPSPIEMRHTVHASLGHLGADK